VLVLAAVTAAATLWCGRRLSRIQLP
jgi:hypothetical protein